MKVMKSKIAGNENKGKKPFSPMHSKSHMSSGVKKTGSSTVGGGKYRKSR